MVSIKNFWKELLKDIYNNGDIHRKDDAEIKELLNISGWIDTPLEDFLTISLDKERYIEFLRDGVFDIDGYGIKSEALAEYVSALDDRQQIHIGHGNAFVYTYPQRLKAYPTIDNSQVPWLFHQIEAMADVLRINPGSNRAVAVLYQPIIDWKEEHIPCLNWMQALIRDNMLYLSVMFRSNDIYNAFPANMFFITYVGLSLVELLQDKYPSLKFEGIYYQCSSAHYYTEFDKDVKKII